METETRPRSRMIEPSAPVMGGIRWRGHRHDIIDMCRRSGGFTIHDPDNPVAGGPPDPEPGAITAPLFTSSPPAEGRVGEEYAYQARAHDGVADGFTWYFESSAPGMAVDRYTGRVTWTPAEGGYVEVILCARSVYGAESRQCWTICVRKAPIVRAVRFNPRFREALRQKAAGIASPPPLPPRWRVPASRNAGVMACRSGAPPGPRFVAAVPLRI